MKVFNLNNYCILHCLRVYWTTWDLLFLLFLLNCFEVNLVFSHQTGACKASFEFSHLTFLLTIYIYIYKINQHFIFKYLKLLKMIITSLNYKYCLINKQINKKQINVLPGLKPRGQSSRPVQPHTSLWNGFKNFDLKQIKNLWIIFNMISSEKGS